ncbi:MAG: GNAT family N-acetyltransferase, partial [Methanocorpusculum sp.]|nr:GNAT family N-acetyltransferase [Methanocorpusculum sp.]
AQADDGTFAGGAFLVVVPGAKGKVGCIDIIFVQPAHRGSGLAKRLYHEAVEMLRQQGCQTIMALVRGDNSQSLRRFECEGLAPTTLRGLSARTGMGGLCRLFIKTASLACATGCWVLCDQVVPTRSVGGTANNTARVLGVNGLFLLCGAMLHLSSGGAWWTVLAAAFLLMLITLGETVGKHIAGGNWRFVMPEGGLVPSAIVALLGGFYPMLGHWYVTDRKNTPEYRHRMALPAKAAWLCVLAATVICQLLKTVYPLFQCTAEFGMMLLLFYMLPFYPFDTFGGRRIREDSARSYAALTAFSIIVIALMLTHVI